MSRSISISSDFGYRKNLNSFFSRYKGGFIILKIEVYKNLVGIGINEEEVTVKVLVTSTGTCL